MFLSEINILYTIGLLVSVGLHWSLLASEHIAQFSAPLGFTTIGASRNNRKKCTCGKGEIKANRVLCVWPNLIFIRLIQL